MVESELVWIVNWLSAVNIVFTSINVVCVYKMILVPKNTQCGPGAIPPSPSFPHFPTLLVSFTFPFLTHFIYFLAFPSRPILPE